MIRATKPIGSEALSAELEGLRGQLTPAQQDYLREVAHGEQASRMRTGWLAYPAMMLILGFTSSAFRDHPRVMWTEAAAFALGLLIRILHAAATKSFTGQRSMLTLMQTAGVVITATTGGTVYASIILFYGYERWTFSLILMWITGSVTAAMFVYAPSVRLACSHHLAACLPAIGVSIWLGGPQGWGFALANILFVVLVLRYSQRQALSYWKELICYELQVTRSRELELAKDLMEKAREEAEAANQAKSEFLAKMSHEIRTPIHGVLGLSQLAIFAETAEEAREHIETLYSTGTVLLSIVNDILDFSKIEAGKLTLEEVAFSLPRLMEEVRKLVAPEAGAKKLKLECRVIGEIPAILLGDSVRLRQVLINLLGNAVKFTSSGSVVAEVQPIGLDDAGKRVGLHFVVRDTGVGIPEESRQIIFEPFGQADSSVTRRFGGTGLGLSICSQLVELMGGSIWVESEVGVGSAFHFTYEAGITDDGFAAKPYEDDASLTNPIRILLAEDNAVNQVVASKMLRKQGHEVMIASDGREAVRLWEEGEFDLILMDNQMPEMSGVEALRNIRERERETGRARIPIIALTANSAREDRDRFSSAGMDAYLAKPFRAQELSLAIYEVMSVARAAEHGERVCEVLA